MTPYFVTVQKVNNPEAIIDINLGPPFAFRSNMNRLNLKIATTLLMSITMMMPACSFRKDPRKYSKTNSMVKSEVTRSFEDTITSNPDAPEYWNSFSNKELLSNNALDLAIKLKNEKLLIYLLSTRGVSPFSYSETSAKILSTDTIFSAIISSYQETATSKVIKLALKSNTTAGWDNALSNLKIESSACLNLFQQVLNLYFYSPNNAAITLTPEVDQDAVILSYKNMATTRTCTNLKDQIPSAFLTTWYESEIRLQFENSFKSTKLLELFDTIGNVQNISINVAQAKNLRVDPRILLFAALPHTAELSKKSTWLKLLSPHISVSAFFYNYEYITPSVANECGLSDPFCEIKNLEIISTVNSLLNSMPMDYEMGMSSSGAKD